MEFNEEDIEDWVEEAKIEVTDEFYKALRKGVELKKAKDEYRKKLHNTLQEYETRYNKMWSGNKRSEALHKPVNDLKKKLNKIRSEFNDEYSNWKKDTHKHLHRMLKKAEKKKIYFDLGWYEFWRHIHR